MASPNKSVLIRTLRKSPSSETLVDYGEILPFLVEEEDHEHRNTSSEDIKLLRIDD